MTGAHRGSTTELDQAGQELKAAWLKEFVEPRMRPDGWTGQLWVQSRSQAHVMYVVATMGLPVERWHDWTCTCPWGQGIGRRRGTTEEPGYWRCAHVRAARMWYEEARDRLKTAREAGAVDGVLNVRDELGNERRARL